MRGVATVLKGINKRVIVIKNLNSELIEEAHFILKNGKGALKTSKENEMIVEANRIISEYHSQQRQIAEKSSFVQEANPTAMPPVSNLANLSDEEIFEDSKFFEHMQNSPNSKNYINNLNLNAKNLTRDNLKSAFNSDSAKRGKIKKRKVSPKSFFIGIGVMSAIVIVIKFIEYIMGY